MKRRNAECGKLRRPLKRSKISESIYGSTFLYLKFLLVWVLVLLADFILEFRFEYLWPFWLLLRSVYDSFKYQGLAFSVFFVCIAITSDMICFLFIPVHWLFFAASTYVWVQYVWHTERGVCLPTVSLWLLFVYIEASVRLRELKNLPIHLDLCRPFAAHCIGYPMVTLGFGFKSYIGYRMRQVRNIHRKQKEVAKENDFYMQLLLQALPPEQQSITCNSGNEKTKALPSKSSEEIISNGVIHHKKSSHNSSLSNKFLDLDTKDTKKLITNNNSSLDKNEYEYLENLSKHSSVNDFDEMDDKSYKANGMPRSSTKWSSGHLKDNMSITSNSQTNLKRSKCSTANNISSNKDDFTSRLEADIKRLKVDLQLSRQCEQDLRAQINSLLIREQSVKNELLQLQQDNDNLQSKLHNLVTAKQQDKQTINALDKKLQEERKYHALAKTQLANERKSKKEELAAASSRSDCTEICKVRRRELENDLKQVHHLLKMREDQIRQLERETQSLRHYEGSHPDTDVLISALSAMQDKNSHLENSLSAETRLKLDLFSALGEVKRQLEIAQNQISKKDQEIAELKTKIAEVMAVFPPTSYPATTMESGINPLYSPKFIASVNSEDKVTSSKLDPNASIYTPKGN